MDKLISQQAAIDALCKSECGCSNAECRHKDGTDFYVTCDNVKIIKSLPSAQPEPEAISKWKKEFREYVDSLDITRDDWKGIIEYIDELPSVQPEIIRCKDCKCWHPQFKTENGNGLGSCDFHDVALVTSKGFCYWAERKENDQRRSD